MWIVNCSVPERGASSQSPEVFCVLPRQALLFYHSTFTKEQKCQSNSYCVIIFNKSYMD